MSTVRLTAVSVHAPGRPRPVLDDIHLTVPTGTCCVIMGPSGAGKTTLLQSIAGLVPSTGAISVGSRDLAGVPLHKRGVSLLFQHPRLFPTMTVIDNVAYPMRLQGIGRVARRAVAAALLDDVGLGARVRSRPDELSGGERQRVALARALCAEPQVLLLDEPLTGLDVVQRRSLGSLLAQLRAQRGLTWMVVTHEPEDAAILADHVAVLDGGRLAEHRSAAPSPAWLSAPTPEQSFAEEST